VVKDGGVPELTLLPDNMLRLFVTAKGIESLLSQDGGKTWQKEAGQRVAAQQGNVAADPSVIRMPDGSWLMTWKRFRPK
jgi:hypothetical protein